MATSGLIKNILKDIEQTLRELRGMNLLLEEKGTTQKQISKNTWELTYNGKNSSSSIVYDNHISSSKIINQLLQNQQYSLLFYDKGLIQAEFTVENDEVVKERLVFMKKHNKIWDAKEIQEYENQDQDWFAEEEGVPIMIRIDYSPDTHIEGDHAATHLTISNHESCRIPVKGIVTFSEFVKFVLFHFYKLKLNVQVYHSSAGETITELEKKMIHMNWI